MGSDTSRCRVAALAAIAAVLMVVGCAPPPQPVLGAGDCIPQKGGRQWIRWDGGYGTDTHITAYAEPTCTGENGRPQALMALTGPVTALPAGYSSWLDVPEIPTRDASLAHLSEIVGQCQGAYETRFGPGGVRGIYVQPYGINAAVPTSLPASLWGCVITRSGSPDTWPEPIPWP